jgi:metallo-beta-lactamase class B
MGVGNGTRTVMLASAAAAACIGYTAYADAAAPRAGAVLAVYDTVDVHIATAARTAGQDANLKSVTALCGGPLGAVPAPVANNTAEPAKVFDNLYFIGIPSVSAWAITTSAGIIVIDTLDNPREAETFVEGGLKKLGLDPMQVKYVIITHAHNDHFGGAQYLADKLHAQLVMSDTDWGVIEHMQPPPAGNTNRGPLPKRGKSVKDGEKLTLGDTTIEIYQTPPHTPGAISLIIPLKDGNQRHVGAFWGGIGFNFAQSEANYTTYVNSVEKFAKVAKEKGADVPMANHSNFDNAFQKIQALKTRAAGQKHPFVLGPELQQKIFDIQEECAMAGRARLRTATANK